MLACFARTPDLKEVLLAQDMICVGGGNTKSLLAVWREWQLPALLRRAWLSGIVLAGVSAGAICWFEFGVTDSWANRLAGLPCLSFLPGTCCPHYDANRSAARLSRGSLPNGLSQRRSPWTMARRRISWAAS
jgi:dipeptidase E